MGLELQSDIERLRIAIESVVGRKMHTPKDFDYLSEVIFDMLRQHISATTLKRLWGYLPSDSMPRESTLDLLSQFAGSGGWQAFCNKDNLPPLSESDSPEPSAPPQQHSHGRRPKATQGIVAVILLIAAIALTFFLYRHHEAASAAQRQAADSTYIIKVGSRFSSEQEYLRRFGIIADKYLWGQVLPGHPDISVWGSQYHHPEWHNDGDSARMMPTIVEWWEPPVIRDSTAVAMRNLDRYLQYRRMNELRITFMRDLVDTCYVFLGVYRLSLTHSDTTRCVWERVATGVDLRHLDQLELLR